MGDRDTTLQVSGRSPLDAPVDYAAIRVAFQSVRLALAVALFATVAPALREPTVTDGLRAAAFAVLGVDAVVRAVLPHRPLGSLLTDAAIGATVVGLTTADLDLTVLLVAYLVIGSGLLVPARLMVVVLLPAVVGIAGRAVFAGTATARDSFDVGGFADGAALLIAITLLVVTAVARLRLAAGRHEEALEAERRASAIKSEFVSMVSHELRTPLTNISGFALAVQESWRDLSPEEVDEFLAIICTEAEHLRNLVDDVLAIPRLEAGRLSIEPVDFPFRPAAYRIVERVVPSDGEHSASVAVPGSIVVRADPNRVEQVLRNLLENAHKHGGSEIQIEAVRRPTEVVVVVADNGSGVPESARDRIFDQFGQAKEGEPTGEGLGLGLAIARRLVEAMGGRIWYEPGFPVGARFCFTLPVGDPAAVRRAPEAEPDRLEEPVATEGRGPG